MVKVPIRQSPPKARRILKADVVSGGKAACRARQMNWGALRSSYGLSIKRGRRRCIFRRLFMTGPSCEAAENSDGIIRT